MTQNAKNLGALIIAARDLAYDSMHVQGAGAVDALHMLNAAMRELNAQRSTRGMLTEALEAAERCASDRIAVAVRAALAAI